MNNTLLKNLYENGCRSRNKHLKLFQDSNKIEIFFGIKKKNFSIWKNSKKVDALIINSNKQYILTKCEFFSNAKKENVLIKNIEDKDGTINYINPINENEKNEFVQNTNINENNIDDNTNKKKKKWKKLKIFAYSFNIIFFSYIIYKVYKNDMNLSKAEESIIKDFVKLFCSYEEKNSLKNSQFLTCLNENLNKQIAMYFIQLDTDKSSGFLISDAINFLSELNIKEDNEIIKRFIKKGTGKSIELKKLSGCSLQEFAELIESLILLNRTKNGTYASNKSSLENEKKYYINVLQYYLDSVVNFIKTTNIYLYYKSKKKNPNANIEQIDDLEKLILDKLTQYNEKYVDKKNLSLDFLLSKEEINHLRNSNISKEKEEKEILLVEKKILEEKIQILNNMQLKKNLTEAEIKRLKDLKVKLKNLKRTIRKEELKKYFFL